jgi:hypothetical protein
MIRLTLANSPTMLRVRVCGLRDLPLTSGARRHASDAAEIVQRLGARLTLRRSSEEVKVTISSEL